MSDDVPTRIDRALAAELDASDVAPDSVEQLALQLRDEMPTARPEFLASLDRRVELYFRAPETGAAAEPENRTAADPEAVWPWERLAWWASRAVRRSGAVRASLAVAASVIVVLVAFTATLPDASRVVDDDAAQKQGRSDGSEELFADDYRVVPLAASSESVAAERYEKQSLANGEYRTPARGSATSTTAVSGTVNDYRRHLLGTGLFLVAAPADVPDVIADATRIARDLDGYPGSSSFDVEDGTATGRADLWVPADRTADAMAELARLGTVERTVQTSRDVTARRIDLDRQVVDDAASVRQFRRNLKDYDSDLGRAQLEALESQLELRRQALANLDRRTQMTLINLRVRGEQPKPNVRERWTVDWALYEGRRLVDRMFALVIIVAAALMIPVAIALLALGAARARRRHLRGRTLDDE